LILILRGSIIVISGFLFIFLPGTLISLVTRRSLHFSSNLLMWGMGVMVMALIPALFLTSVLRVLILGNRVVGMSQLLLFALLGSLISALFLEGGKFLFLRWRKISTELLLGSGIMLGFGTGLLINVFQGISMVGAGLRLTFGDTAQPELAKMASQPWVNLLTSLLALNAYRIALVAISAMLGGLVARVLITRQQRWLWLAVLINTAAAWAYTGIGLVLGNDSLTGNLAAILLEGLLAALAIRVLFHLVPPGPAAPDTGKLQKKIQKR